MEDVKTSDPDQKRISIDNYKGLMTRSTDDQGNISWDIQLPFNNSLLTFQCSGIADEKEVLDMANSIPVSQIVALAQ